MNETSGLLTALLCTLQSAPATAVAARCLPRRSFRRRVRNVTRRLPTLVGARRGEHRYTAAILLIVRNRLRRRSVQLHFVLDVLNQRPLLF